MERLRSFCCKTRSDRSAIYGHRDIGVDGIELARRAREQNPCLKVLFASGGFGEDHLKPTNRLLRMPFSPRQLTAAIAEALDTE
jgi:CheY-like chemotaxis protein